MVVLKLIQFIVSFFILGMYGQPVIDFVRFSPSVIAAAAVVSAAGKELESLPLTFYERVEKVMNFVHLWS